MIPEPGSFTTPTPRTDDQQWVPVWNGMGKEPEQVVDADFARQLERELAATTAELNRVAKEARAIALQGMQSVAAFEWLKSRMHRSEGWEVMTTITGGLALRQSSNAISRTPEDAIFQARADAARKHPLSP